MTQRENRFGKTKIAKDSLHASIDPFVQQVIAGTSGLMYRHLINRLPSYPIPDLRLPRGDGQYFLDIGCNWGRWCVAAAQKDYRVVGIDPSLDAVAAAHRVAAQLNVSAFYIVADAKHLPFKMNSFDTIFSYSVLQHFDKDDVKLVLLQIARVLKPSGTCLVQMANTFGMRNLFSRLRRLFKAPKAFDVVYWKPSEMNNTFNTLIGPSSLSADGFFSLNAQVSDREMLPWRYQLIVLSSEALRHISEKCHWMVFFADSIYIRSTRELSRKSL